MYSYIWDLCSRICNWLLGWKRIKHSSKCNELVIDYYDGPLLSYLTEVDYFGNPRRDSNGHPAPEIICMREKGDWFLGAEISPQEKQLFNAGKIDLRSLFLNHSLYKIVPEIYGYYKITPFNENISENFLPEEGYYLDSEGRLS